MAQEAKESTTEEIIIKVQPELKAQAIPPSLQHPSEIKAQSNTNHGH